MSGQSFPDEEFQTYCRVTSSFKCKASNEEWAESLGTGENCDEADDDLFEMITDFCARAGERDPIFRTIDWKCNCDRW